MTVGSLFAGIGGFDLGLERAGFIIQWQVEIDDYCQRVLAKHWPDVPRYGDIRAIDWATVPRVDLLCGGFPCQDLSFAGKRAGIDGTRSGLWSEYVRAIRALRPRYVLVENVPGLLSNAALGRVLRDLAESGYDAEWDCIPASAVGAPHRRDRVWLVAYANNARNRIIRFRDDENRPKEDQEWSREQVLELSTKGQVVADTKSFYAQRFSYGQREGESWRSGWWELEPDVGRVAHGVPARVDRLRGLGNAVVPQVVEWIGRRILEVSQGIPDSL